MGKRDWSKTRKSTAREWSEALLWAVVVAGSLRMLIVEPFTIPTPSMEDPCLWGTTSLSTRRRTGPSCPRPPCPCRSSTTPYLELTPTDYTSWFTTPYTRLPGWRV